MKPDTHRTEPAAGFGAPELNLAVGNDRTVLVSTVTQLVPFIGYPRSLNALRLINERTSP